MKRMAKLGTTRRWGAPDKNPNRAVTSPNPGCAGPAAFGWAGQIACLLLAFAMGPLSLGAQENASNQHQGTSSVAVRAPDSPVQAVNEDALKPLKPLEKLIEQGQYQQAIPGL
ncbi:MAG: hypothetical protein ACREP9_09615, partial [Candidatus Dormibacteraceae bacterium]